MTTCNVVLCIDAGGTYFKSAIFTQDGTMPLPVHTEPVDQTGSVTDIVNAYVQTIRHFQPSHTIVAVAISTPGPFDYRRGISFMKHKFAALYGQPLAEQIRKAAGIDVPIAFMSDTNAFLAGAAKGCDDCMGITIGTGLGLAIMRDGNLLVSETGGPAEVIYNHPIDGVLLEDIVSGRGISQAYFELTGKRLTAKEVSEQAFRGDLDARLVYQRMGDALGRVLDPLIAHYQPRRLFFGGQVSASLALFRDALCGRLTNTVEISGEAGLDTALKGVFYTMTRKILSEF